MKARQLAFSSIADFYFFLTCCVLSAAHVQKASSRYTGHVKHSQYFHPLCCIHPSSFKIRAMSYCVIREATAVIEKCTSQSLELTFQNTTTVFLVPLSMGV